MVFHFLQGSNGDEQHASRTARFVADIRQLITLKQHYYPEGGWGWIVLWTAVLVHVLANGFIASAGFFQLEIARKFGPEFKKQSGNCLFSCDVKFTIVGISTKFSVGKTFLTPVKVNFCVCLLFVQSVQIKVGFKPNC